MPSKINFLLRSPFVAPGLMIVNKPAGSVYSVRSSINIYVCIYRYIFVVIRNACLLQLLYFSIIVFCAKVLYVKVQRGRIVVNVRAGDISQRTINDLL